MKEKKIWNLLLFVLLIILNACAFDIVKVKQIPTSLDSSHYPSEKIELEEEVKVSLGTGYSRQLKSKTIWEYVGKISHGDVFKTRDQVLTIEASNVYEAYIVIYSGKLVGFYLPVEKTFSPISNPKALKFRKFDAKP